MRKGTRVCLSRPEKSTLGPIRHQIRKAPVNFDLDFNPLRTAKLGPEVPETSNVMISSHFSCFLHQRCEQVPSKRWDGGPAGAVQCYSYRSLRQHSPTRWIIIWLCQYCSRVGEEWQPHAVGTVGCSQGFPHTVCRKYRAAAHY